MDSEPTVSADEAQPKVAPVTIVMIVSPTPGVVYGLGEDNIIYTYNLNFRQWVLL